MMTRSGRLIREKCGRPLVQGKLNMDAWLVDVKCGGDCHKAGASDHHSELTIFIDLNASVELRRIHCDSFML